MLQFLQLTKGHFKWRIIARTDLNVKTSLLTNLQYFDKQLNNIIVLFLI